MARKYSVKAGSRRLPVKVFYNILDLAAINARVLYQSVTKKRVNRILFILQFTEELHQEHLNERNINEIEDNRDSEPKNQSDIIVKLRNRVEETKL